MNKLIITNYKGRTFSVLWDGSRIIQMQFAGKSDISVGNIYLGIVRNIVPNINAAFIEIAPGLNAFYPIPAARKDLRVGELIPVQVIKEAVKSKAQVVSSSFSFPGKFLVLTEDPGKVAVSSKITDNDRRHALQQLLADKCTDFGFICRTNSRKAADEQILAEADSLAALYARIRGIAACRTCYSCLYEAMPAYLSLLRDTPTGEMEEILTDRADFYQEIRSYLADNQPDDVDKVRLYADKTYPLEKLYRLERFITEATGRNVWLPSGGYLVIEPTEALTVIDVNTGKYDGNKDMEETFLKINREAAEMIAYQLRLRNISGIIIVDFIDMKSAESRLILQTEFREMLNRDPVKTVLVDCTTLNLMELTRKKIHPPIAEQLRERGKTS